MSRLVDHGISGDFVEILLGLWRLILKLPVTDFLTHLLIRVLVQLVSPFYKVVLQKRLENGQNGIKSRLNPC